MITADVSNKFTIEPRTFKMPSIQPDTTLINLNAIEYSRAETVIVKSGGMTASAFL